MTAGYRSRVTGGAGGVSLRAAGEQHTHVAQHISSVVPCTMYIGIILFTILSHIEKFDSTQKLNQVLATGCPKPVYTIHHAC